jgi:hypothetical protein
MVPIALQATIPSHARLDARLKAEMGAYLSRQPLTGKSIDSCLTIRRKLCIEEMFGTRHYHEFKYGTAVYFGDHSGIQCQGFAGLIRCQPFDVRGNVARLSSDFFIN